jgi:hypothetical protein
MLLRHVDNDVGGLGLGIDSLSVYESRENAAKSPPYALGGCYNEGCSAQVVDTALQLSSQRPEARSLAMYANRVDPQTDMSCVLWSLGTTMVLMVR